MSPEYLFAVNAKFHGGDGTFPREGIPGHAPAGRPLSAAAPVAGRRLSPRRQSSDVHNSAAR